MRRMVTGAGLLLAVGGLIAALPAASAWAKSGSQVYSADQVGYAATGAKFSGSEIQVKLPSVSNYAREVGQVGISVQLWSKRTVVDFDTFACTDRTCLPGGKPQALRYRFDISVYRRATGALVCSTTAASASVRCSDAFPSWNRVRFSPGSHEILDLQYDKSQGLMLASANAENAAVQVTMGAITQARIVVQFGATPFSKAPFKRPHKKMLVMTLGGFAAEFILTNGKGEYIGSPLFVRHKIDMTWNGRAGHAEATPTGVYDYGAFFRTYFA